KRNRLPMSSPGSSVSGVLSGVGTIAHWPNEQYLPLSSVRRVHSSRASPVNGVNETLMLNADHPRSPSEREALRPRAFRVTTGVDDARYIRGAGMRCGGARLTFEDGCRLTPLPPSLISPLVSRRSHPRQRHIVLSYRIVPPFLRIRPVHGVRIFSTSGCKP